ncbi:nucleotidyltransferase domain-containing protein [Candidatus Woesearchaeota archaeon]|nr:nucleotidyltransferase domain-containing protein [Candidatus Woesearchaeota archaeon]
MQTLVKEQIVKTVVKSGNGGAVWVPKDWLGEEVVVILPQRPKLDLKEKVIHLLEPYLKDIISVAIYGSYARGEQTKDSDIDVLAITKDKELKLDFKRENIEVTSFPAEKLKKAIQNHPALYYQIIKEAIPLINAPLLEELKQVKITKESFKEYLGDTGEHLESNKGLLELDKKEGLYLSSYSVLYSIMLRLRTLFIIQCILEDKPFSNKKFKSRLKAHGLSSKEYEDIYKVYRLFRDDKSTKSLKIKLALAEKLLNILEVELKSVQNLVDGK